MRPNVTLNYGLRYDYYVPLREADNRIVKFNIDNGQLDPNTTPLYKSKKNNFQPRVSATYSPTRKTVSEVASAFSWVRARPKTRFSRLKRTASAPR